MSLVKGTLTNEALTTIARYSPTKKTNCVLSGPTVSGVPSFLYGTGSNPMTIGIDGATEPVVVSFSDGYDTYGEKNWIKKITSDVSTGVQLSASDASGVHYFYADIDTTDQTNPTLSYGRTMEQPQYVYNENQGTSSIFNFEAGDYTDLYGARTLTATGSSYSITTTAPKFGSYCFNISTSTRLYLPKDGIDLASSYTIETWFKVSSASTNNQTILGTDSTYGLALIYRQGGVDNKIHYNLSGNGTTWSIASNVVGTKSDYVANQWYHLAVVYNPAEGYRVFVDGTQDYSTSTTTSLSLATDFTFGANANTNYFSGSYDDIRVSTYPIYRVNFTPPTSAFTKDALIYDINKKRFKYIASNICRMFLGEITWDNVSRVASFTPYAYNRQFISTPVVGLKAAAQLITVNHNLGINPELITAKYYIKCTTANNGFNVGDIMDCSEYNSTSESNDVCKSRLSAYRKTGSTGTVTRYISNGTGTAITSSTNWAYFMVVDSII